MSLDAGDDYTVPQLTAAQKILCAMIAQKMTTEIAGNPKVIALDVAEFLARLAAERFVYEPVRVEREADGRLTVYLQPTAIGAQR